MESGIPAVGMDLVKVLATIVEVEDTRDHRGIYLAAASVDVTELEILVDGI